MIYMSYILTVIVFFANDRQVTSWTKIININVEF